MTFNIQNYKSKTDINFRSMGLEGGNFSIDAKGVHMMYDAIANETISSKICLVEQKTPYFRLFWDLDIDDSLLRKFKKISVPEFWAYMITMIITVLKRFIIEKNKDTFKYIYSDRIDFDHKLHLYFPHIILNSEYCLVLRQILIKALLDDDTYNFSEDHYNKIIDPSVFKANGLRLMFQKKKGQSGYYKINIEKSTLKNIPTKRAEQLQLTSLRTSKFSPNVMFVLCKDTGIPLIDLQKEEEQIKVKHEKVVKNTVEADAEAIKKIKETNYDINLIRKLTNNLSIKRITNYETWVQFVFLCRNYGWVELAHDISKKAKNYSKSSVNNILNSIAKGKLFTIGSLMYWSKLDNEEEHLKILQKHDTSKILAKNISYEHNDTFERYADEVYEDDFVHSLDLDTYDTFIIKAATGTGKTEKIIEAITKVVKDKNDQSITVLASRIVLAINIHGRFKEPLYGQSKAENLKMKLYEDVEEKAKNLHKEKRIIQTPDSLIYMIDHNAKPFTTSEYIPSSSSQEEEEYDDNLNVNIKYPDVLFIDEIESLLNYVCTSSTLKSKRKEIFSILNEYIINAKYVFLVDSNVTTPVCNYIKKLREGHNVNVIFNKKKTNDTKYYLCYDESYWNEKLLNLINKGHKVFVGCDSKKQTEMLETQLQQCNDKLKIKIYNCDTDDESRKLLAEVNKEWSKYDCIICSPTIIYGLDFNKMHFDYVFGFYTKTITASSVYQQLNRIRKIGKKEAYIYVQEFNNTNVHPMPTTIQGIENYYFKYQDDCKKELEKLSIDSKYFRRLNTNDVFTKLYLHFQCEINRCENNFIERLIRFLTEFGGEVYELKGKGNKSVFLKEKEDRVADLNNINNEKLIKASEKIELAQNIHNKKSKTTEDRKILTAHKICKDLNLDKLNHEFLDKIQHIRNVEKLTESFKFFNDTETLLKDFNNNIDNSLQLFMKKKYLIESGNELYFKDGILSNETINVYQAELTPEMKLWWDKNGKDILHLFKNIRQDRVKINDQVDFFKFINRMNDDFFCGLIERPMTRKTKQIDKKRHNFYECSNNPGTYIELYLNANKNINTDLLKNLKRFDNNKCQFSDLHDKPFIKDLIISHENKMKETHLKDLKQDVLNQIDFIDDDDIISNDKNLALKMIVQSLNNKEFENVEKYNNVWKKLKDAQIQEDLKLLKMI